ncbi:tetratricopeptide repeat protein [Erythrobacter jejuensis]|uniref:Tetratricopeptide repeat protein n=2 Tax=Parerythrobacter jejuensis TaxID=795812 RepID=A0A845AXJ6_9SPHN|nr:tetratricopeptide repeat protein [Parerythrobacter jejuensis]
MGAALLGVAMPVMPALAQSGDEQARIRKLEGEVRALQRRVFPGSDGRYFEPQISGSPASNSTAPTTSTTAVTDILARLDALEASLQRLTGQVEENTNTLRGLTTRMAALEGGTAAIAQPSSGPTTNLLPDAGETGSGTATRTVAAPETTPEPAGPSAERLAAVQAIAKPQTDDAGDDEYSYGFRLWNAGFYPEAQQQLAMFVEKYPNHSRATYGRNLLGRAYLDDGKPRDAAPWFLRNYQADRNSRRAPDSLLYLAEAMIALEDTSRACIALAEFGETYPALAAGRLQSQYEANRQKVTCN